MIGEEPGRAGRSAKSPAFWTTVRILLSMARKRARGRFRRQQQILNQRGADAAKHAKAAIPGKPGYQKVFGVSVNVLGFAFAIAVLFMSVLNIVAACMVMSAVSSGARVAVENTGKIVVDKWFYEWVVAAENTSDATRDSMMAKVIGEYVPREARDQTIFHDQDRAGLEQRLHDAVTAHGAAGLVVAPDWTAALADVPAAGPLAGLLGTLVLACWAVMMVSQGEGLELDLQRRRHPMWEWLFSHPVPAGAVFLAEMLTPIATNPMYWCGPWFVGVVFGFAYGVGLGIVAMIFIGIPLTLAAACVGKAIEIRVLLRATPRNRGAIIGIMSWLGYATMMVFFVLGFSMASSRVFTVLGHGLGWLTVLPWPWLGCFLGEWSGGKSFPLAVLIDLVIAVGAIAIAVNYSANGMREGVGGNPLSSIAPAPVPVAPGRVSGFGRDPLYRKEILWFLRDRSAIVQTILIPLTLASMQLFNLRGLIFHAQSAWNLMCGGGIVFGTYFLWVLGPKSLASEGAALWIALTWPRGLEELLKAKAWLWSLISTAIVGLVLIWTAVLFPADIGGIALVGVGWYIFSRSQADKAVTLVTITSSSGETERAPRSRQWAASLGMLTFALGLFNNQWQMAVMGIVYSHATAAAMWENFRARLPYLFDPWSEQPPPAPTLMHAMIAISILVEGAAVITTAAAAFFGHAYFAMAQVVIYALCAVLVAVGVARFLRGRGVANSDIWCWATPGNPRYTSAPWWCGDGSRGRRFALALALGLLGGLVLGVFAILYEHLITLLPGMEEAMKVQQTLLDRFPDYQYSYAIIAVFFAPFAEEYLFRGMVFRTLDRAWGGWRAVLGAAAFFAIYHPATSWLPVGLLGAVNAVLFKRSGRLAPAVLLHMTYNAVVVGGALLH